MGRHRLAGLAGLLVITLASGLAVLMPGRGAADAPDPVRIGLVQSMFRDVPAPLAELLTQPFRSLMHAQTGMNGRLVAVRDYKDMGRQLHDDKLELGVFHGIEFGWAHEKYRDLRPLCIAVNRRRDLYAYVVTGEDSAARHFADLKGQTLCLPRRTPEHCQLFLERACAAAGGPPARFFGKTITPANVEAGLDDVLRGKAQAAVVDGVSLECYRQVKPGCYARLKMLEKSPCFPATVVAYHEGALDEDTLTRFKTGMITANQNERGRELLSLWKLTAFEAMPADYEQNLAAILKAYPPPAVVGPAPAAAVSAPAAH
jgi:ABC-type phosphate/phosphonate transport system substrate-binding protein